MTWAVRCDGPDCDQAWREGAAFTTYKPPGVEEHPSLDDRHFCTDECLLRWLAGIPAGVSEADR